MFKFKKLASKQNSIVINIENPRNSFLNLLIFLKEEMFTIEIENGLA